MKFIADLHIHSKHSCATSKNMDLVHISHAARRKGIHVVGTGDFTHPAWMKELEAGLRQDSQGLYAYDGIKFIFTAEVSNIYTKHGRGRRIHNIIMAPDLVSAKRIQRALAKRGNILSDGRPIFGFDAKDLVKICLDISEDAMIIPAHIWTPWFSVFGFMSGFESIEECFEEQSCNIHALETGLSADPAMCRRVSALDKYSLVSNSDAHSPDKLAREANVFDTDLSYKAITKALKTKDKNSFLYTIEFFPEEGKYHYDGHRMCDICFSPQQTREKGGICPVCGKPVTVGVMNRVEQLADRPEDFILRGGTPFKKLMPLLEIISYVEGKGVSSKAVKARYAHAIECFDSELNVLLSASPAQLSRCLGKQTSDAVLSMRQGSVGVQPGYDGVYGIVVPSADKASCSTLAHKEALVNAAN